MAFEPFEALGFGGPGSALVSDGVVAKPAPISLVWAEDSFRLQKAFTVTSDDFTIKFGAELWYSPLNS